jgi:hypothetical protein
MVVRLLRGVCLLGAAPLLPLASGHVQDITAVDDVAMILVGMLQQTQLKSQSQVLNVTACAPTSTASLFKAGEYSTPIIEACAHALEYTIIPRLDCWIHAQSAPS